ncbi:hypothetical protein SDC9_68208 [bioreactor metagenome]|uniref:YbjN domain-containing protein n=1 Tax=bioreactor metagenome TaxID=1076179 RepID=A0A644Y5B4_9ZZZZ|nr:hypothetical protein [Oscillibacter sp.]
MSGRFRFLDDPDGAAELAALLEDSGVPYKRSGSRFELLFTKQGRTWRTVCDCEGIRVLIYGIHPQPVSDSTAALAVCSDVNRQMVRGACFLAQGRIVCRTSAELSEPLTAREILAQALEYNAAVLSNFWEALAAGASGSGPFNSIPSG